MRKFDTKVQYLKYKVLREVARHAFNDTLLESFNDSAKVIVKGPKPTMRCCIYKERAIVGERMKIAMATETQGRVHTSAASVAVLPEAEEFDVVINEGEIMYIHIRSS